MFAGLDFNSGTPVAVINSSLASSEGCSSVSDKNGHLLFYTDGESVWNKNNAVMFNGKEIGGRAGAISSTQSCIIVVQPGSNHLYYIITCDESEHQYAFGYRYAIVDMLSEGGLGAVIQKNILLYAPCTEKLAVALHSNNKDIWIITHGLNTNTFVSFLLTETGLSDPVYSNVGSVHGSIYGTTYTYSGRGCMKVSPDGTRIALMFSNVLELLTFDRSAGTLSDPINIPNGYDSWGLEFSPDGTKLYRGTVETQSKVYQYNLKAGDGTANDIEASKVLVYPLSTTPDAINQVGSIQNGPDGKMYVSRIGQNFLSVITDPDKAGRDCGFVEHGVELGYRMTNSDPCLSQLGLPNFPSWYFQAPVIIASDTCFGSSTNFFIDKNHFIESVLWNFGDTVSTNNTSSSIHASHIFSSAGTFTITAAIQYKNRSTATFRRTIYIIPSNRETPGRDTLVCSEDIVILNRYQKGASYQWNTGSTNHRIEITKPGIYAVSITNGQCKTKDSIHVIFRPCRDTLIMSCDDAILPNLITPNGDHLNDVFYVACVHQMKCKIEVYTSWGSMVYYNDDYKNDWNAEGIIDGVYYFILYRNGQTPVKNWIRILH